MSESHTGHFWRHARQPWAVHWWERHAPFLGKTSNAFPLGPGMPRAILTLPLCFLILLISPLSLLPVSAYTLMCSHKHIHTHARALMWCLLRICANSFPLNSLLLASYGGQLVDLRQRWVVSIQFGLFLFGRWPQHKNLLLAFHCCGTMQPKMTDMPVSKTISNLSVYPSHRSWFSIHSKAVISASLTK